MKGAYDPIMPRTARGYRNSELNNGSFDIFKLTGFGVRGPEFSSIPAASLLLTWALHHEPVSSVRKDKYGMYHIMLWGLNEVTPVKLLGQIMTEQVCSKWLGRKERWEDGECAGNEN